MSSTRVLNIVVPMAGLGSRFSAAGYKDPKPLINVAGEPMIQRVIENLKPSFPHRFIFICQEAHYNDYRLPSLFADAAGKDFGCVNLNGVTEGAACTVLTAESLISDEDDLVIANSDQLVDVDMENFYQDCRKSGDGTIMTFNADHPKWSYARTNAGGRVEEVAEKKVISPHATVGIYYFRTGRLFKDGAKSMIAKNIRVNNEFYVCPVYNELIGNDADIRIWSMQEAEMHGIGTPEDLAKYIQTL